MLLVCFDVAEHQILRPELDEISRATGESPLSQGCEALVFSIEMHSLQGSHRLGRLEKAPVLPCFLLVLCCILTVQRPLAASDDPGSREVGDSWIGMSLEEALHRLRSDGLAIVFSDALVPSTLRVESEPESTSPRTVLDELLAPHGLEARPGPGDTLVVALVRPGPETSQHFVGGLVRDRASKEPIAGALVRDVSTAAEAATDGDGKFLLALAAGGARVLEVQGKGYLNARIEGVPVSAEATFPTVVELDQIPVIEERLHVSPSRISLLQEAPVSPLSLSRQELEALPHLGGDFYRALTLLPGTTGNDVSAQFYVRGGRRDETQILIDGQELYEGFHLKDRDSALSLLSPEAIGAADLNSGGFTAEYGDRMSGVLDMTTVQPQDKRRLTAGAGVLSAHVGGSGVLANDGGGWIVQARRGTTDLVGRLLGAEDPEFWDAFGKLDRQLGPRQRLRLNALFSRDLLDFRETIDGESKQFNTEYGNTYAWLTHQAFVAPQVVVESAVSAARIDRDRRGLEDEEGAEFLIRDSRDSEILSLRQTWDYLRSGSHSFRFGWLVRDFDTEYDYMGTRNLEDPLARIRHDFEQDLTAVMDEFEDLHQAVHFTGRWQAAERVTAEYGARWDSHSLTSEDLLSPRLNVAWGSGRQSVVRVALGRYNQSQRPYELSVEDGESFFKPVEISEHRIVGFERFFDRGPGGSGLALRMEIYQREVDNPRPQYVNLFEPLNTFPEVEPDRVLLEPDRSRAEGFELFLRTSFGRRLGWWANYSYSSSEDRIGGRWTPRLFDQTHALNLDIDYRISDAWRINTAWRYHTGWPTTPLTVAVADGEDEEGDSEREFVPLLGPINSQRVADYHRLDVRLTREWRARWGSATIFVDIQNLYDRENVAGFDIELDDEEGTINRISEAWTGILPSAGVRFEF